MSKVGIHSIECPECHKTSDVEFWDSVNVDLNPELREKIFNDEIFRFTCPKCGTIRYIKNGMIYHNMKEKFMLFFDFDKPFETSGEIEIPALFNDKGKEYTFRAVYGLERFKEKILILENGLNDIAVEHMKYMIEHVILPEKFTEGSWCALYFIGIVEPDEKFKFGQIVFGIHDSDAECERRISFAMDNYYEHKMACEIDPRMKPQVNCPCIDQEWMACNLIKD